MRTLNAVLLASAVFLLARPSVAQSRITALPSVALGGAAEDWHVEPWLAADPGDPRRLFAAAITLGPSEHPRQAVVAFASRDGGETWLSSRAVDREDRVFPGGDPGLVVLSDGSVILSTGSSDGTVRVWRSDDGLRYERLPDVPGGAWDRPFLIEAPARGDGGARLLASGKLPARLSFGPELDGRSIDSTDVLGLAVSGDSGRSWDGPRLVIPDPHYHLINSVGSPVVAANGALLRPYFAFPASGLRDGLVIGDLWLDGTRTSAPARVGERKVWANRGNLRLAMMGLAVGGLAVDRSDGPHRGRVYACWLTLRDSRYQVVLARSDDHGTTWSEPSVVNDDASAAHHANPGLAVSSSGTVGVLRNDRRARPDSPCFETRFAASLDGGATSLPSVTLSMEAACPPPGADDPARPFRFLNGGDTQGLVGLRGDAFMAVWIGAGEGAGKPWAVRASRLTVER